MFCSEYFQFMSNNTSAQLIALNGRERERERERVSERETHGDTLRSKI